MRVAPSVVVSLALAAACGGGGTEPGVGGGGGGGGGPTCTSTTMSVAVADNVYQPNCTTVAVGSTVTWNWTGVSQHTVTFNNTSLGGSAQQASGNFSHTFNSAGTFAYHCLVHGTAMAGQVKVQ